MLASEVMAEAAVLLNDASQTVYTNTVLLPFLSKANDELERKLQKRGISLVFRTSANLSVVAAATTVTAPSDMFLPLELEEKSTTVTEKFQLMQRVNHIPDIQQTLQLTYWSYEGNAFKFVGALSDRLVRVTYLKFVTVLATASTNVDVGQAAKTCLAARTAELAAGFIGENFDRASVLHDDAETARNDFLDVLSKNMQGIGARRRPFRATVKGR